MKNLSNLLLELLQIDSPTGREQFLSKSVYHRLEKLKAFQLHQVGLSLCYFGTVDPELPTVGFFGHLDTVQDQQDDPPCIEDGKVFGCGASDMKAGLAVMIRLMMLIEQNQPKYNTVFVFYDREEGPYLENGLEPVLNQLGDDIKKIDLAFMLEPTSNQVQMGCVGGLHGLVRFAGKSAHSARPWQGENALQKSAGLLQRLSDLKPVEVISGGLSFFEVIHATQGSTENRRNSIPGEFVLNLNYRFAPGKPLEQAKEEFLALIQGEAEVEFVDQCPSAVAIENNSLFDSFLQQANCKVESKQAWTDIARLAVYGIEGVNFGPGQPEQAHQKNESVLIAQLQENLEIFSSFLFFKG